VGGANRAEIDTRSVSHLIYYHFHRKRTLSGVVTPQVDWGREHHLEERKTVVGRCLRSVLIGGFPFLFQELPLGVLGPQRKQGVVTKLRDVSETPHSFGHVTLIWVVLFLT
jgi:hypothetical protein